MRRSSRGGDSSPSAATGRPVAYPALTRSDPADRPEAVLAGHRRAAARALL